MLAREADGAGSDDRPGAVDARAPLLLGVTRGLLPLDRGTALVVLPPVLGTDRVVLPPVLGTDRVVLPLLRGTALVPLFPALGTVRVPLLEPGDEYCQRVPDEDGAGAPAVPDLGAARGGWVV